jgi:hypothetical protein
VHQEERWAWRRRKSQLVEQQTSQPKRKDGDDFPVTEITVRIVGERAHNLMEILRVCGGWKSLEDMILCELTSDFYHVGELAESGTQGAEEYLVNGKKLTVSVGKRSDP